MASVAQQSHGGATTSAPAATRCTLSTARGDDYELEVCGYRRCWWRTVLTWCAVVLTAGLLRIVFHWRPRWMLLATHARSPLRSALVVLIIETYQLKNKSYFVKKIKVLSSKDANNLHFDATSDCVPGGCAPLPVVLSDGSSRELETARVLHFKKEKFVWDEAQQTFLALCGIDQSGELAAASAAPRGLAREAQDLRRIVYGLNMIEVPLQSVATLVLLEVLNPFYMFQVFSLAVWFSEGYYYYTIAIIIMSIYGISSNVLQTYRNQRNLHSTVHSLDRVEVLRGESLEVTEHVPAEEIVPGDVVVIPTHGCTMQCDAVLLRGTCIVNESMLTGESVPVTKTCPVGNFVDLSRRDRAHHTLFCGTKVIQTRYYAGEKVLAVVTNTAFMTAKGNLVRSILYPPPVDYKFDRDAYKFIGFLALVASFGLIYTIVLKIIRGVAASDIALKALDILTIVVPPALPAAMTVGRLFAQTRLQAKNIFCINSRVINIAGSIDCVCFDKTGTLTEDGLDMWGVVPVRGTHFEAPCHRAADLARDSRLPLAMAACHTLTRVEGCLLGDPLDVKMFEFSGWEIEEPEMEESAKYDTLVPTVVRPPRYLNSEDEPQEFGIAQQFQFSSSLQRMSVITRQLGHREFLVLCKGSPEMICSLSQPATVPADFPARLSYYSEQGYRVLAVGWRVLSDVSFAAVQRLSREEVEKDLTFGGFIVLENRLKLQTAGVVSTLRRANVKMIMVTGDNILTAVSVARECGLILPREKVINVHGVPSRGDKPPQLYFTSPESQKALTSIEGLNERWSSFALAMSGVTWAVVRECFPELLPRLLVRGVVFARMSPDQKQQLVGHLQELGYYVAMCGDGANDCGALKAAHVGISLSEAESSVASPFTSREANISCVPLVIKEGRAALVTSFGVFKFMAAYSLTQFVSVMILYSIESNLTDFEFLYIDLCLSLSFAFFFGHTQAFSGALVSEPPLSSLISPIPILSIICQMILNISLQCLIFFLVPLQSWYVPFNPTSTGDYGCHENYAVFALSLFQYIGLAVVFSKGPPYREPIWTNYGLSISVLVLTVLCSYITIYPADWIVSLFELVLPPPLKFRLLILIIAAIGFMLSVLLEGVLVDLLLLRRLGLHRAFTPPPKYAAVRLELDKDEKWPAVSAGTDPTSESTPRLNRPPVTMTVLTENGVQLPTKLTPNS